MMIEIVSEEKFWERYSKTGRFPDEAYASPKGYPSESKRRARYAKYLKWVERTNAKRAQMFKERKFTTITRKIEIDERWVEVQEIVKARDKTCRLIALLSSEDYRILICNSGGLHKVLDCAHIKSRGAYPHLKYDPDNIVLLNRFSHSMLDSGKHPLTGRLCTNQERDEWWAKIVG